MNKNQTRLLSLLILMIFLPIISYKSLGRENTKQNSSISSLQVATQNSFQSKLSNSTKQETIENTLVLLEEYKTYSDFLDLDSKIAVKANIDEKPTIKQDKVVGRCEIYKARVNFYDIKKKNKLVKQITKSEYGQFYCKKAIHPSFANPDPIQYSPDGKLLAVKISSGAIDEYIHLYDISSNKLLHEFSYSNFEDGSTVIGKQKIEGAINNTSIDFAAFSQDGRLFAAASEVNSKESSIRVWDIETGKMVFYASFGDEYQKYKDEKFPLPFMFSPDKKYLHWFAGISWNINTGEELSQEQTKTVFKREIGRQIFSSDRRLGLTYKDGLIEIVDINTGEIKSRFDSKPFFEKDEVVLRLNQEGKILITAVHLKSDDPTGLPVKIRYWQIK